MDTLASLTSTPTFHPYPYPYPPACAQQSEGSPRNANLVLVLPLLKPHPMLSLTFQTAGILTLALPGVPVRPLLSSAQCPLCSSA